MEQAARTPGRGGFTLDAAESAAHEARAVCVPRGPDAAGSARRPPSRLPSRGPAGASGQGNTRLAKFKFARVFGRECFSQRNHTVCRGSSLSPTQDQGDASRLRTKDAPFRAVGWRAGGWVLTPSQSAGRTRQERGGSAPLRRQLFGQEPLAALRSRAAFLPVRPGFKGRGPSFRFPPGHPATCVKSHGENDRGAASPSVASVVVFSKPSAFSWVGAC